MAINEICLKIRLAEGYPSPTLQERFQNQAAGPYDSGSQTAVQEFINLLSGLSSGSGPIGGGSLRWFIEANSGAAASNVSATRTIQCVNTNISNSQTVTIGNIAVLTVGTEFAKGADSTATAVNLATAINASAMGKFIYATSATDTVTLSGSPALPDRVQQAFAVTTSAATGFVIASAWSTTIGGADVALNNTSSAHKSTGRALLGLSA